MPPETISLGDIVISQDAEGLPVVEVTGLGGGEEGAAPTLNALGDVVLENEADLELLQFDGATSRWVNRSAAEAGFYTEAEVDALIAGKADSAHTHAASDITAGTFGAGAYTFQDALAVQDMVTAQWLTLEGMGSSTMDSAIEITRHSASGTFAYRSKQTGDAFPRFTLRPNGQLAWGPGTSAIDTLLQRTAEGTITISNHVWARTYNTTVAAGAYGINGAQVVGARKLGWGSPTGVATRTAFDTAVVTLPQLAERVKALIDDLRSHGLIGA